MIKLRVGCFETNSSSMHSVAVTVDAGEYSRDDIIKSLKPHVFVEGGGRVLKFNEDDLRFGRYPFMILNDFYNKLCYTAASLGKKSLVNIRQWLFEVFGIIDLIFPIVEGFDWDACKEVCGEYTGSVDHQSDGVLTVFLRQNNISVEEFLLNKQYWVIVDGDEYEIMGDMITFGIANKNRFLNV